LKLILNNSEKYHVSLDTVHEFEQVILSDVHVSHVKSSESIFSKMSVTCGTIFYKLASLFHKIFNVSILLPLWGKKKREFFVILMGLNSKKCLPYFLFTGRKSVYLFDAWPNQNDLIIKFIERFKITNLFLSSSQAAEKLRVNSKKCNIYWVPEGINPDLYKQCPYNEKEIDVLQFGRKYDKYHKIIVEPLKDNNKLYLYEKIKGEIIFPTRKEFIENLARTKISICFPSNITHPERSGTLETMTIRYLQSMVSKCLIIGHAPEELITLFGYNPVVEIDMDHPVKQLLNTINNFTNFIPFIENNFTIVLKNHCWHNRWENILGLLPTN
jgi:hypothetical protein